MLIKNATGTTFKEISKSSIRQLQIELPPLSEQKRIVVKIESILAQIDAAKERLERLVSQTKSVSGSLNVLRSSVLKQAFEGRLVPQDPRDESTEVLMSKRHKNSKILVFEKNGLPKGWVWTSLDQICLKINDGTHSSPPNNKDGDVPYVTAKNVRPQKIDLTNATYVTKEIHKVIYSRCNPEKGDVLYTKDGSIGYAAVNEFDFEFSLLSSVSLLKPMKDVVNSHYLSNYLNSPQNFNKIMKKITGTALRRIILERIKEIQIPLCPLNEQKRIVTKIESIFAEIDAIEQYVKSTLQLLDQLKNSTLKQAFEGKLVPQDPNDEPAEFILQKIKQ